MDETQRKIAEGRQAALARGDDARRAYGALQVSAAEPFGTADLQGAHAIAYEMGDAQTVQRIALELARRKALGQSMARPVSG